MPGPEDDRSRIEGSLPPPLRGFLDAAPNLAIAGNESELTIDDGRGLTVKLVLDGSVQKDAAVSRVAKWDGPSLVVESRVEGGTQLLTRYNLMPGARRIEVYSMLSDSQHRTVTVRRVYDTVEPSP